MIRRPPRSTRTDTLFPYTTLFRSKAPRLRGFFFDNDQRLFAIAAVVLVVDDPDQVAARAHRLAGEHQPALALVGHLVPVLVAAEEERNEGLAGDVGALVGGFADRVGDL